MTILFWKRENLCDSSGVVLYGLCGILSIHLVGRCCQMYLGVLRLKFVWTISRENVSAH